MLDELHEQDLVSRAARDDLREAYLFLRELEHRLQMIADEQTQRLPAEAEDLARFANFCGYATLADFSAALTHHLERVAEHYADAVRDRAGSVGRDGQSCLHRRQRRSRNFGDFDPARLPAPGSRGGNDPRLAFRPPRGREFRTGARGLDRVAPGAARSLRRIPPIPMRRYPRSIMRWLSAAPPSNCCRSSSPIPVCANCSPIFSAARRGLRRSSSAARMCSIR